MALIKKGNLPMDFITSYKLENYILDTKWEDLPKRVQERAIVCTIDLMMALILGSKGNQFKAGVSLAKNLYKEGDVPVVGLKDKFSVMGATVAMGHASNSFDIDDGHNMIKGHPGTSFIAGILAAALDKDISYKKFLTTLVIAYETAIRSGLAMQDHYNFLHSTGAYGAVGTCAGMGRIFGLNKEQLNNALSIADFHAPLTPVMRAVEYPSMNKDGVPFGALVGATALYETLNGSIGKTYTLELKEYEYLLNSLGLEYEIMNLYFKPYTCCRWAHPAIEASLSLINGHKIDIKDIKFINVRTFISATRLSKIYPKTTDEAQYNISYPIAVGIVDGDVGIGQVIDKNLGRQEVLEMMAQDSTMECVLLNAILGQLQSLQKESPKLFLKALICMEKGIKIENMNNRIFDSLEITYQEYQNQNEILHQDISECYDYQYENHGVSEEDWNDKYLS